MFGKQTVRLIKNELNAAVLSVSLSVMHMQPVLANRISIVCLSYTVNRIEC